MSAKKASSKSAGGRCPVYVVCGKDRRRVTDKVSELVDELLGEADPQVCLNSYEGDQAELSSVLDDLRTLPFLSDCRVVVVKGADDFISSHRGALESYVAGPSSTGVLVMSVESFPGNTRLAKAVSKVGEVINFEPIKSGQLGGFLVSYASERYGLKMDRQAVSVLIELGGDDAGLLMGEVDKVATYLSGPEGTRDRIGVADVQALVGHNRQFSVFNVIDAMTVGDVGRALSLLDQMMAQDRDAQFKAVGAFAWHFRRLYRGRSMVDHRMGDREVIKQLRIWMQQQEFMAQVRRLSLVQIGDIIRELTAIDLASKTGAGTVQAGLEKLIVTFCERGRGAA